jgi:hypothetical protein
MRVGSDGPEGGTAVDVVVFEDELPQPASKPAHTHSNTDGQRPAPPYGKCPPSNPATTGRPLVPTGPPHYPGTSRGIGDRSRANPDAGAAVQQHVTAFFMERREDRSCLSCGF